MLATYQLNVINSHQEAINLSEGAKYLTYMVAGGVVGASMTSEMTGRYLDKTLNTLKSQVSSLGKRGDVTVTYTVRYEI